jgi:excinuclease ABC subunit C
MHESARSLKFEEAAELRNAIRAIESLSENNSVADMDPENRDYIAWAVDGIFTTFSVLSMRGGRMTGRELFNSRSAAGEDESLETFIAAYYSPDRPPPPKIYLDKLQQNLSRMDTEEFQDEACAFHILNRYFLEQFGYAP